MPPVIIDEEGKFSAKGKPYEIEGLRLLWAGGLNHFFGVSKADLDLAFENAKSVANYQLDIDAFTLHVYQELCKKYPT